MQLNTLQEVFETSVTLLAQQGYRSKDPISGACLYSDANNSGCALGLLMPDDLKEYLRERPYENRKSISSLLISDIPAVTDWYKANKGLEESAKAVGSRYSLLESLQALHDGRGMNTVSDFKEIAKDIALEFSLDSTFIDALDFSNFKYIDSDKKE